MPGPAQNLFQDKTFWSLPWEERKKRVSAVDPAFAKLSPADQDIGIQSVQQKYQPKESFTEAAQHDLSIGWRSGMADVAKTGANVLGFIPTETTRSASKELSQYAKREAPAPQELAGRDSLAAEIFRGIGSAGPEMAKYAPAMLAKRGAPIVAGVIGAAGEADKGLMPALTEGGKQALNFYMGGKASNLPTRTGRAVGTAALMAVPTAIESGGDMTKTAAAMILGGTMGAATGKPKASTRIKIPGEEARKSFATDFYRMLNPGALGHGAPETMTIARAQIGALAQTSVRAEFAVREARKIFDKLPLDKSNPGGMHGDAIEFVDKIETGDIRTIPTKLKPYAKALRDAFDERRKILEDSGMMHTFVEDYFPHLWTRPAKAKDAFQYIGKRPLEGPKGFMKQRKFLTMKEALEFSKKNPEYGLEPISSNPIDIALLKLREMDRFITARKIMGEMKENRLLQYVKSGDKRPDGWVPLDDNSAKIMARVKLAGPKEKIALAQVGQWYAPNGAAQVIRNYLSPGLRDKPWFNGYLNLSNSLNQFQLGWSAFHLGFTTVDAATSQMALALQQVEHARRTRSLPQLGKAAKAAAKTYTVPFEAFIKPLTFGKKLTVSNKIIEEYRTPGSHPEVAELVRNLKDAGGRIDQDPFYHGDFWRKYRGAIKKANYWQAALKLPPAINEQAMRWLFEYVVPMQKIGAFHRLGEFELSKLPPDATTAMRRAALQRAWQSVDNRMGQLVYDNQFWHKITKDILNASTRSVGWNYGTIAEIGGGVVDSIQAFKQAVGSQPWEFTSRMAYIAALPITTGIIGGIAHYLMTGKAPEGKDYWFPSTGRTDEYGREIRDQLPSYVRDVMHLTPKSGQTQEDYVEKVWQTAKGKLHPALSVGWEAITNEDWQKNEIRHPEDDTAKKLYDTAKFVAGQWLPFSLRFSLSDLLRAELGGHSRQFTGGDAARAFFGMTPAPMELQKAGVERLIDHYVIKNLKQSSRTKMDAERSARRNEIERAYRSGNAAEAQRLYAEGLKRGESREEDLEKARARSQERPILRKFKQLQLEPALIAYRYAQRNAPFELTSKLYDELNDKVDNLLPDVLMLPENDPRRLRVVKLLQDVNMQDRAK